MSIENEIIEECSDILTMFNFIPEQFGIYKLKNEFNTLENDAILTSYCPDNFNEWSLKEKRKVELTYLSSDGIIRKVAPLMEYKDNYYPYLAFLAGSNYLVGENIKDFKIDRS